jgi:hypothetical protein
MLRHKLWDFVTQSGARAQAGTKMQSNYTLLQSFNAKGQMRIVIDDEVEAVKGADAHSGYRSNP